MTLLNPFANSVANERIGRSAQLIVRGPALTAQQHADVQAAYARFKLQTQASVAGYHVRREVLHDGTQLRIVSNGPQDTVYVITQPEGVRPIELAGYHILPADKNHTTGWGTRTAAMIPADKKLALPPGVKLHTRTQAGAVHWIGPDGQILSYDHGGRNRYATNRWHRIFYNSISWPADVPGSGIYYKGTKINSPAGVHACAIFGKWLVAIVGDDQLQVCPSPLGGIDQALKDGVFRASVSPPWTPVAISGSPADARRCSAWHFKPDGSRAACAVIYTAGVLGSWSLEKGMTQALPQAKRYLDLSLDGSGNVTATWSDSSYTTEPWACYVNGTIVTAATGGIQTGSLTFTGRRLWGVDYDADGNEIVVSCRRSGTGTSTDDSPANPRTATLTWDVSWGVFANEDEIFRADYDLPLVTVVVTGTTPVYTANAGILNEYLAVHALDARFKAAVVERLSLSLPGAVSGATSTEANNLRITSAHTATPYTTSCKLQYVYGAAVVGEETITLDPAYTPTLHANLAVQGNVALLRYGQDFRRSGVITNNSNVTYQYMLWFPQVGDYDCENIYEQIYDGTTLPNRTQHNLFEAYPNQLSDILAKLFWQYTVQILTYDFTIYWDTARLGARTSNVTELAVANAFGATGLASVLNAHLAIRTHDPLHFIAASKDAFTNQFYDQIKRLHQQNLGQLPTGRGYTYHASAFTREDTADPFIEDKGLITYIADAVDAEQGAGHADRPSFHFDPVKVL